MDSKTVNGNLPWYLIHTNPMQEGRAESNLMAWNVETFAPRIKKARRNQFTNQAHYISKPLFARYVFARFDFHAMSHKIRFTRGVHDLVNFGYGPVVVDEEVIALIKSRTGKDGFVRLDDELKQGDAVLIESGPLKGFTGIFNKRLNDYDRVRILLNIVSYQAHVEVDRASIKKIDHANCSAALV